MTAGGVASGHGRGGAAWRRAGDRTLRLIAAMPLGYGVASLWAVAIAHLVPLPKGDAVMAATMFAFAICAAAAMWAYAAPSGWRATWTLTLAGAAAGLIAMMPVSAGG